MAGGELTPPRSGDPDPGGAPAPAPMRGATPRRWIPDPEWSPPPPTESYGPGPRRSALTPMPEGDDEPEAGPRRSAMSPLPEDDELSAAPRRSALSPIPQDDDDRSGVARRSAMSPIPQEDDDRSGVARRSAMSPVPQEEEETIQLPLPRRSTEYGSGGGIAVQLPLPAPDLLPKPLAAPVQLVLPTLPPDEDALVQPSVDVDEPSPVTTPSPPDPSVQATLPAPSPTPSWPPSVPSPDVDEPVEPTAMSWSGTDPPPLDVDDHALFRRPAPGEPETQWDLTPISAASPDEVVPVEQETTITAPTRRPGQGSRRGAKAVRARGSRRHLAWRDHRRLLTVLSIVVGLLLVVGVGGYVFSRLDPTLGGIAQGDLTLPLTADGYTRDPAQGVSPSVHPDAKISTVSATYSRGGVQQFVVIAYRPQTNPEAALQEIQARNVARVSGGACGRTTDQNLACVVISGTTAVLAVALVDQTADDLIASAQSIADGIGKD